MTRAMGVVATAARETAAAVVRDRGAATRGARARGVRREMAERDAMVWMEKMVEDEKKSLCRCYVVGEVSCMCE